MPALPHRPFRSCAAPVLMVVLLAATPAMALKGNLEIYADAPGAGLYIDGVPKGVIPPSGDTPVAVRLPPGEHVLELRREVGGGLLTLRSQRTLFVGDDTEQVVTLDPPQPVPAPDSAARIEAIVRDLQADMAAVPAGTGFVGSPDTDDASPTEFPRHTVRLAKPFALGRTEVTFEAWDACVADGGCRHLPDDRGGGRGQRPVVDVSWEDVRAFLAWLSNRTGRRFRLPSEAEWEIAARAGSDAAYFFGDDPAELGTYAWFAADRARPVRQKQPNPLGLHDMLGNVAEWVEDCWHPGYDGAPADGAARDAAGCKARVVRGGAWNKPAWYLRTASRSALMARSRYGHVGFRLAADP